VKVPMRFEFDEETLRRMRAEHGRAGVATRKEARAFVETIVGAAIAKLPQPKRRGDGTTGGRRDELPNDGCTCEDGRTDRACPVHGEKEPDVSSEYGRSSDRAVRADDPRDPFCGHKNCRAKRSEHKRMGLGCPGLKVYQRFKGPIEEPAEVEA
jgi:hypothetical protein